ncbi:hypothetical protein L227DRAFT_435586 [Lentinus tigrinus ALCF2SS1-6]|uniref:Uncharacterized protein n=1 Tax=Lentinus tigrinus ALCF2SS1-6 TaxID=1328759 RepID=A0A5C2SMM9_9APHY|nr:hypothetical protein L227DRAFT_435586 [Lentinus tigrinus ALCF2SS1-6]
MQQSLRMRRDVWPRLLSGCRHSPSPIMMFCFRQPRNRTSTHLPYPVDVVARPVSDLGPHRSHPAIQSVHSRVLTVMDTVRWSPAELLIREGSSIRARERVYSTADASSESKYPQPRASRETADPQSTADQPDGVMSVLLSPADPRDRSTRGPGRHGQRPPGRLAIRQLAGYPPGVLMLFTSMPGSV